MEDTSTLLAYINDLIGGHYVSIEHIPAKDLRYALMQAAASASRDAKKPIDFIDAIDAIRQARKPRG